MPTYKVILNNISCFLPDETTDEVYLKFKGNKIWPTNEKFKAMKDGSSDQIAFDLTVEKDSSAQIELWDYDALSSDDKLGDFHLEADKMGGPYTSDMIKSDTGKSKYSLNWEVR